MGGREREREKERDGRGRGRGERERERERERDRERENNRRAWHATVYNDPVRQAKPLTHKTQWLVIV